MDRIMQKVREQTVPADQPDSSTDSDPQRRPRDGGDL
jgi:hypothetical protein